MKTPPSRLALLLVAGLAAHLLSCATGPAIDIDYDPDYDFAGRESYAWLTEVPVQDELLRQRLVSAIDRGLEERGYRRSSDERFDLRVHAEVFDRTDLRARGPSVGVSVGRSTSWGSVRVGGSRGPTVEEIVIGTLVVTIADATSLRTVWRARIEDTVGRDSRTTSRELESALADALRDLPRPSRPASRPE